MDGNFWRRGGCGRHRGRRGHRGGRGVVREDRVA